MWLWKKKYLFLKFNIHPGSYDFIPPYWTRDIVYTFQFPTSLESQKKHQMTWNSTQKFIFISFLWKSQKNFFWPPNPSSDSSNIKHLAFLKRIIPHSYAKPHIFAVLSSLLKNNWLHIILNIWIPNDTGIASKTFN